MPRAAMVGLIPCYRARSARSAWLAVACSLAFGLPALATAQAQAPEPGPPANAPAPAMSTAASCTDDNVVRRALVTGDSTEGFAAKAQDGQLATEGTTWNAAQAVQLKGPQGTLKVDLRATYELRHLLLQGDNNDNYVVESSDDGVVYRPLWTAPPVMTGQGLRTRFVSLPNAQSARYLRVRGTGGDGYFSVSELRAYCKQPKPWPPALILPPTLSLHMVLTDPVQAWKTIDNPIMVQIKGVVAAFSTVVLLAFALLAWRNKTHVLRRTRNALLAALGLFSFFSFWNLGHYHFDHYIHIWEHYHYYVGAKYGPELRFSRLYECTAAADMADGLLARVKKRNMRDLAATNELMKSDAIVADPTRCTKHFTPERWEEFRKDLRFFRGRFSRDRWDESQNDHGYNGTPVWGILGRALSEYGEVTWEKIEQLGAIDSGLLVLMWVVVWWTFGWQAACVGLLWWGLNFPARFYWNGGSLLRYDWQFWMVIGICFLKKKWNVAAGMALTYATLLRVFPGFVVAALILKALARMVRHRKLVVSRSHLRFAIGCVIALSVLIPASSWSMGGLDAWGEFAQNSKKHLSTALTNNMGLKTVMGYEFETRARLMRNNSTIDPFKGWKEARHYYYGKSKPVMYAFLLLFLILLAKAADREPDWAAACLGTGLIVMASELTCYYYGFLLTYGLLWQRRKLPGVLATALAGVTCLLAETIGWNDDHFAAMSLACVVVIVAVTAHIAFGKTPSPVTERVRQRAGKPAEPLAWPPPPPPPAPQVPSGSAAE
jgi:hypothetical protein